MRNKIEYIGYSKSIVDNVTSNVVLFGDDINPEVLQQVCQMYNTKATINAIQSMLDRNNKCTGEEGEYIVEQLEVYEKSLVTAAVVVEELILEKGEHKKVGNGFVKKDAPMTPHEVAETLTAIVNSAPAIREVPSTNIAAILPGFATEPGTPAPLEKKGRKQTPAVRTGGKVLSSEDVVKQLKLQQEKTQKLISMIEWLDASTVLTEEFPDGLQKDGIELLIRYGKDLAKLKSEYIGQIQQL